MDNKFFGKIYDNRRSDSWSSNLRKKRVLHLESLISSIPNSIQTIKILDVGGRPEFWEKISFIDLDLRKIEITIINVESLIHSKIRCIIGDARNMSEFRDREFDIVCSNSVIEHVGDYPDQRQMANEVKRVGKKYLIQTPNLYFPIEPHFLFPCFQFLPINLRIWLLSNFDMGWYPKMPYEEAKTLATQTQLLSKHKFTNLFPEAKLYEEKIFGLTKSFIAIVD